ncbi:MAG: transcription elongation factor GreA [Nitrospinae bacterium]|nr:transcription elongation factor GreA [Nitrospinota bacterium]
MLKDTIAKLEAELGDIKRLLASEIPNEINRAASLGDLKENAEYHAAREKKRNTEARGAQISERIRFLRSIDFEKIARDSVGLGSLVTLEDLDTGKEVKYELVIADLVDAAAGKISIQAPIGKAMLGKKAGDEFSVVLPAGKREYMINKLVTIHNRDM